MPPRHVVGASVSTDVLLPRVALTGHIAGVLGEDEGDLTLVVRGLVLGDLGDDDIGLWVGEGHAGLDEEDGPFGRAAGDVALGDLVRGSARCLLAAERDAHGLCSLSRRSCERVSLVRSKSGESERAE
jgi:hypothetical protein